MRTVHRVPTKRKLTSRLCKRHIHFLEDYYECICDKPTLNEVEELSKFIDVKKESVYWWFHNKRKSSGKKSKVISAKYKEVKQEPELSLTQDVVSEGPRDRILDGPLKRTKTKAKTNGRKSDGTGGKVPDSGRAQ